MRQFQSRGWCTWICFWSFFSLPVLEEDCSLYYPAPLRSSRTCGFNLGVILTKVAYCLYLVLTVSSTPQLTIFFPLLSIYPTISLPLPFKLSINKSSPSPSLISSKMCSHLGRSKVVRIDLYGAFS